MAFDAWLAPLDDDAVAVTALTATPGLLRSMPFGSCCVGGSDGVAAGVSPTGSVGAGAGVGTSSTGSLALGAGAGGAVLLSGALSAPPQAASAAAKNRDVNADAVRDRAVFTATWCFMVETSCDRFGLGAFDGRRDLPLFPAPPPPATS